MRSLEITAARLVGRRGALRWLGQRLDEAATGRSQLVIVSGDAGIGKTRLAQELAALAVARAIPVCTARCDERRPEPYGPLLESLFPLLRDVERAVPLSPRTDVALRALLGQHRSERNPIDEILEDPDAASRFGARLLLDLADLVIALAQRERLLLLVDDLAWADASTFRFVVRLVLRAADLRRRGPIPLLVVATIRPDLDPTRRVELDRLRREEICSTLELEGLDLLETAELLRALGVERVTPALAEHVHRATTGNPLFVETVGRRLLAASDPSGPNALVDTLPQEIREALGDSLARLSHDCRAILRVAAVLGTSCAVDVLLRLSGAGTTQLEDTLEEAGRHGIVEVVGERVSFRHPLYRALLYRSTSPARRRSLHAAIATSMAERQPSAELAEHLIAAGPEVAPALVARTCSAAADEAAAHFAWGEAARFYREAVAVEERAPGVFEEDALARLLQSAGVACDLAMDGPSALRLLRQASERFKRLDDERGLVQTALARVRCLIAHREDRPSQESVREGIDTLVTALDKLSDDADLRAHALAKLAEIYWAQGEWGRATEVGHAALEASQACGSAVGLVRAHIALGLSALIQLELPRSLERFEAGRSAAQAARDPRLLAEASMRQPLLRFWLGRAQEAETSARDALGLAHAINDPVMQVLPLAAQACLAVTRGEIDDADELVYQILLIQRLTGYTWVSGMFLPALATLQSQRGEVQAARRTLAAASESWDGSWRLPQVARWFFDLYVAGRSGDLDGVRRELEAHPKRTALVSAPFLGPASWAAALVELGDALDEPELARAPADALRSALERGQRFTAGLLFHVPRVLGMAERLLGRRAAAVERLRDAVEETAATGAWVEHALALRELARALVDGGPEERQRALPIARAARDALAGLGLEAELPAAERVLVELGAEDPTAAARDSGAPLTIVYTDVEGSTPLVEQLGDARALELLQEHDRIVREELAAWGGWEVDQEGDSFFAAFERVEDGVRCAKGIQRALARMPLGGTIRVRIGVHVGEVLREGGRLFGLNVIVASRIAAAAEAGEILVSAAVRDALGPATNLRFGPRRTAELKGLSRSYSLLPLTWGDARSRAR